MGPTWKGKIAVITGASSGIGASLAKFLSQLGMHVFLTARREERLRDLHTEVTAKGGTMSIFPADLSSEDERKLLFEKITAEVEEIDLLINNAGIGWYGYYADMPWEVATQMAAVNVVGMMHMTRLFLPGMLAAEKGHIINIGSIAGSLPNQGIAAYSASKAFMDAFTTALHRELKGSSVHASVMRLGAVRTEFYDRAREQKNGRSIPAERFAVSTDSVNRAFLRLINRQRRVIYIPGWLAVAKYLEIMFAWAIDQIGPVLLKRVKEVKSKEA